MYYLCRFKWYCCWSYFIHRRVGMEDGHGGGMGRVRIL